MRQRLNKRRPRHTEPYARPQRRESLSAKIEASDSAAIPLAPACRYLGTDLNGRSDRPGWVLEAREVVNRTPCIFNLTPRPWILRAYTVASRGRNASHTSNAAATNMVGRMTSLMAVQPTLSSN